MSRYVGRPSWLSDDFEICALYVLDEVDRFFLGMEKPKKLVMKGYDPLTEPRVKAVLGRCSQLDLADLCHWDLYSMTIEAFIYFMPSFARLCLTVDDFDSNTPAEDGCFDRAVISKCEFAYEDMNGDQQGACKCLVAMLLAKSDPSDSFACDLEKWKLTPAEDFWLAANPWLRQRRCR